MGSLTRNTTDAYVSVFGSFLRGIVGTRPLSDNGDLAIRP